MLESISGFYFNDIGFNCHKRNKAVRTLSKILCKCKQDSVVSSFLYLDSVFKNEYKLIHN